MLHLIRDIIIENQTEPLTYFRSESFKEDKEVLLNRLRIYKHKDDNVDQQKPTIDTDKPPRSRRRSTHSNEDSTEMAADSLEEDASNIKLVKNAPEIKENQNHVDNFKKETKPMKENLKSLAAIFEQNNQRIVVPTDLSSSKIRSSFREQTKQTDTNYAKNLQETREKMYGRMDKKENFDDLKDLDFIRHKRREDDFPKEERRRHTYDSRERETESDRLRRISLENRSPK